VSLFRKAYSEQVVNNLNANAAPVNSGKPGSSRLFLGQESSLQLTAVYACVRLLAETVAALPVHLYRKDGPNRILQPSPAWLIKPNPEITRFELFERTIASLCLDGNAFWYFEHDRLGRIVEVWPLHPSSVTVQRNRDDGEIEYRIGSETYDGRNILHIRAFSGSGGLRGLSPIALFRNTALALTRALEDNGRHYFENGSVVSGVISIPDQVDPGQLDVMADKWIADHSGVHNAHLPGFLTGGATWTPITVPNEQAQFLQSRQFQVTEVCRIFRVPPHKIAELSRATFSNIEHQGIEFATDSISPWTARIEGALGPVLEGDTYVKFDLNGLLRGDTMSRFAAYNMGIQGGWLNADEPRAWEDLDPIPDGAGQVFRAPLNMAAVNGPKTELDLTAAVNAATALIRAGYEPGPALAAVGLDPIAHTGLVPITVKPEETL
jgi:HK97 family phage portal protein